MAHAMTIAARLGGPESAGRWIKTLRREAVLSEQERQARLEKGRTVPSDGKGLSQSELGARVWGNPKDGNRISTYETGEKAPNDGTFRKILAAVNRTEDGLDTAGRGQMTATNDDNPATNDGPAPPPPAPLTDDAVIAALVRGYEARLAELRRQLSAKDSELSELLRERLEEQGRH